jgi:hypothetical protein
MAGERCALHRPATVQLIPINETDEAVGFDARERLPAL